MHHADFDAFLARHARELRGIVLASQGQWDFDDLLGEAFVAWAELSSASGHPLALDAPEDAALLLKRLKSLANRTGRVFRKASRSDQSSREDEHGERGWDKYAIDDGEDALSLLETSESPEAPEPTPIDPYHSESAAWNWLWQRFHRSTREIAAFLLISSSWCRQRRKRALRRLDAQSQLPHRMQTDDDATAIQPWRKFKLPPPARHADAQLALDFWCKPAQPERGQLWLL